MARHAGQHLGPVEGFGPNNFWDKIDIKRNITKEKIMSSKSIYN